MVGNIGMKSSLYSSSAFCSVALLFLFIASLPDLISSCHSGKEKDEVTVYGTEETYTVPETVPSYSWYTSTRYEDLRNCEVLFKSYFSSDHVKITFDKINLDTGGYYGDCVDKIVLYDGDTKMSPILKTICGGDILVPVQSTNNFILLVFTRDLDNGPNNSGFTLTYQRIDRVQTSSGGVNIAWTAFAVPALGILACFLRCAFMQCKSLAYDREQQQMEDIHRDTNVELVAIQPQNSNVADRSEQDMPGQYNNTGATTAGHAGNSGNGGGDGLPAGYTSVQASAPRYQDVVGPGQYIPSSLPPPPSYEEAASGKYDPKPS